MSTKTLRILNVSVEDYWTGWRTAQGFVEFGQSTEQEPNHIIHARDDHMGEYVAIQGVGSTMTIITKA